MRRIIAFSRRVDEITLSWCAAHIKFAHDGPRLTNAEIEPGRDHCCSEEQPECQEDGKGFIQVADQWQIVRDLFLVLFSVTS